MSGLPNGPKELGVTCGAIRGAVLFIKIGFALGALTMSLEGYG